MAERLVINAKGEEKIIYPQEVITPEKKPHVVTKKQFLNISLKPAALLKK